MRYGQRDLSYDLKHVRKIWNSLISKKGDFINDLEDFAFEMGNELGNYGKISEVEEEVVWMAFQGYSMNEMRDNFRCSNYPIRNLLLDIGLMNYWIKLRKEIIIEESRKNRFVRHEKIDRALEESRGNGTLVLDELAELGEIGTRQGVKKYLIKSGQYDDWINRRREEGMVQRRKKGKVEEDEEWSK